MPKEMINVSITRQANEKWGLVIVGGKDQVGHIVIWPSEMIKILSFDV